MPDYFLTTAANVMKVKAWADQQAPADRPSYKPDASGKWRVIFPPNATAAAVHAALLFR